MASNDYYNSFEHPATRRYDDAHSVHPSKVASPFNDDPYTYGDVNRPAFQNSGLDSSYHGASGHKPDPTDPFGDKNAIPMRNQGPSMESFPVDDSERHTNIHRRRTESGVDSPLGSGGDTKKRFGPSKKKKGFFSKPFPWAVYILTTIQIIVFLSEIVRNAVLTKSPIGIKPHFNPMIGPSPYVLINMGARYNPCMRAYQLGACENNEPLDDPNQEILWPCPNSTVKASTCSLSDLCGFGGVPNPKVGDAPGGAEPNQWWRFIVPMFLHAGLIHIGFNMLIQVTLGRQMEKVIGTVRFVLVYFSSGIFGFVLGGNYAAAGIASTGASGSLFGIIALVLLDLLYTWGERRSPIKDLLFILLDVLIAFALGLLPGLDNFSHIGGFIMGLVLGICILHSPNALRRRIGVDEPPYVSVARAGGDTGAIDQTSTLKLLMREPLGFFKGRKPLWWLWWLLRAAALVGVLVGFIVLLRNFYIYRRTCSWCKYLSCINVNDWCDIGSLCYNTQLGKPGQSRRRDLFDL